MKKIYLFVFITIASYFPLFLNLETIPMMIWDEVRLAVSASEMNRSGNIWVVTYWNMPDLWSVKPPLSIWAIALSFKALGYNELALRLPSALFGLFTVWLIFFFCLRQFKNEFIAVFSVLVLITSNGYIDFHVTRTGDYDAMLIFFETAYLLFFIQYILEDNLKTKKRFLYLSAAAFSLAIFTKGIAGLFFMPAIFIFLWVQKELINVLKDKHFYYALLLCLTPVLLYFPYREHLAKGYLEAVWKMELFGRYTEGDGDNSRLTMTFLEKFNYYVGRMYESEYFPWFYLVPFGVVAANLLNKNAKRIALLLFINALIFLTILTFSNSKKEWYESPVYPTLAVLVGIALSGLFDNFKTINLSIIKRFPVVSNSIFIVLLLTIPYFKIIEKIYLFEDNLFDWQKRQYRPFMLKLKDNSYEVLQLDYNPTIDFTKHNLNKNQKNITSISARDPVFYTATYPKGHKFMVCEKEAQDSLNLKYTFKVLETYRTCEFVEIIDRKGK
jgi:4-amino-4-deoxy-L-arabinose transferase-like glycosyltransferase